MGKRFKKLGYLASVLYLVLTITSIVFIYSCSRNERQDVNQVRQDTTRVLTYRGDSYTTEQGGSFIITGKGIEQMVDQITEKNKRESERLYAIIGSLMLIIWGGLIAYIKILSNNTKAVVDELGTFRLEFATLKQWKVDKDANCERAHDQINEAFREINTKHK